MLAKRLGTEPLIQSAVRRETGHTHKQSAVIGGTGNPSPIYRNICVASTAHSPTWTIRIRYPLPPPAFSESGIQSASATGNPIGFLWIYVQGLKKWANKNLDSDFFFLAARIANVGSQHGHSPRPGAA